MSTDIEITATTAEIIAAQAVIEAARSLAMHSRRYKDDEYGLVRSDELDELMQAISHYDTTQPSRR